MNKQQTTEQETLRKYKTLLAEKTENCTSDYKPLFEKIMEQDFTNHQYYSVRYQVTEFFQEKPSLLDGTYKEHQEWIEFLIGPNFRPAIEYIMAHHSEYPYQENYYRRPYRNGENNQVYKNFFLSAIFNIFEAILNSPDGIEVYTVPQPKFPPTFYQSLTTSPYIAAYYVDQGEETLISMLRETLVSEKNVTILTRSMIMTIVASHNQELVELLGNLLLAAQRQEGLRQSVLESADSGTIENFRYFIRLTLENNLIRFASAHRSILMWTNLTNMDIDRPKLTTSILQRMNDALEDEATREQMLESEDKTDIYSALWAEAVYNTPTAVEKSKQVIQKQIPYRTATALCFIDTLQDSRLNRKIGKEVLKTTDHPEIVAWVSVLLELHSEYAWGVHEELTPSHFAKQETHIDEELAELVFATFQRLELEIGKTKVFYDTGLEGNNLSISKNTLLDGMFVAAIVLDDSEKMQEILSRKPSQDLLAKYVRYFLYQLRTPQERADLIDGLSRVASTNQSKTYINLMKLEFTPEEIIILEKMLRLKTPEVRKNVLEYLAKQPPEKLYQTIERLLGYGKLENRLGGLDLVKNVVLKEERCKPIQEKTLDLVKSFPVKSPAESALISDIITPPSLVDEYTVDNGFGLYEECDDSIVPPSLPVVKTLNTLNTLFGMSEQEMLQYAKEIKEFEMTLKDLSAVYEYADGSSEEFLFQSIPPFDDSNMNLEEFPFGKQWKSFFKTRQIPPTFYFVVKFAYAQQNTYSLDSDDGLFRSQTDISDSLFPLYETYFPVKTLTKVRGILNDGIKKTFYYNSVLFHYFKDQMQSHPDQSSALLENVSSSLAFLFSKIPDSAYYVEQQAEYREGMDFFNLVPEAFFIRALFDLLRQLGQQVENGITTVFPIAHAYYQKSYQAMEGKEFLNRALYFLESEEVALALEHNIISEKYFYKILIDNHHSLLSIATISPFRSRSQYYNNSGWLGKGRTFREAFPKSYALTQKFLERLVPIEIGRSDRDTIATPYIRFIHSFYGTSYLVDMLTRLDPKDTFSRNSYYTANSKKSSYSDLIFACYPAEGEDSATFQKEMEGKKVPEQILINVAMFSKQWIPAICDYLGWDGLESLIWYFRAHTGEQNANREEEIAKYSKIPREDFEQGSFDIHWFQTAYKAVGKAKFEMVYDAAKYISSSNNHRRAQIFADAALGNFTFKEVETRIKEKRNQDFVRAYGIMPFKKNKEKDILDRYRLYQKFLKESKQFGSQRQASERNAVEIGLENLARNADYPDITTFTLVMESQLSNEITVFFQPTKVEEYTVQIVSPSLGKYSLQVEKEGTRLKSLPAKIKKHKTILSMQEALKNMRDQYRRSIQSFERMMETDTSISAINLMKIMESPIFFPLLEHIVFTDGEHFGYLRGNQLVTPQNTTVSLEEESLIKIAHPYDLYQGNVWAEYQKDLFEKQAVQPFKQVFRELYLANADELEKGESQRYAGHQLQSGKLFALMKTRGWLNSGQKVFYDQNITATLYGLADYGSPSDMDDSALELIRFYNRYTDELVPIKDVPPIVFSEIMRDVDLFVSVAYVGGVDPEASLSTIEMRTAIVREMLPLLSLDNVTLKGNFALIQGTYGEYSVHMGSGMVQMTAQGSLSILPIPTDKRGKLFLPFMDQDPKTAEIVSKILLLAKDDEIKDPTIMAQIKR